MLTKKQQKVYNFISWFWNQNNYAPSCQDIADHLGATSRGSMLKHINALIDKAYITKTPHVARGIQLKQEILPQSDSSIPFLGKIAAGSPLVAFEYTEQIDLNHHLGQGDNCYLLKVSGESMIGVGIADDDLVLIRAQHTAKNGQIVVALIDNYETTLKRYQQNDDSSITLSPENRHMSAMIFNASRVSIQGVLVAHIRQYHVAH